MAEITPALSIVVVLMSLPHLYRVIPAMFIGVIGISDIGHADDFDLGDIDAQLAALTSQLAAAVVVSNRVEFITATSSMSDEDSDEGSGVEVVNADDDMVGHIGSTGRVGSKRSLLCV